MPSRRSAPSCRTCRRRWGWPRRAGPRIDDPRRRDEGLRDLVPRNRRRPYDVRALLASVCDQGSVFELGAHGGHATVTALARLDGCPVAVLAGDPPVEGGLEVA